MSSDSDESPSKMAEKTYSQSRDCKLMTAEESIGDIGNEEVSQIKPQQQKFGEKDQEEFPEGGRGWFVLIGTFFVLNTTYGLVNTFGVYQDYYLQQYPSANPSIVSLIGSLQPSIIYFAALPVPALFNHIGVNWSVFLGSIIMIFSLMMLSLTNSLWQVYLCQGILWPMGAGIAFFTAISIPTEWFKRRRALALGITASGSSLGGVIWPIAFQRLVAEVGFPWANRIIAFIFLPILIFASYAIKSRFPDVKQEYWPNFAVLKDWRFVLVCIANGLGTFGLFPPLFYITSYAQLLGLRPSISMYVLAILNGLSIIGRVLPAYVADKLGRLNVLIPSVFLCGVLQYALWLPAKNETLVLLFVIIWGACSGVFISLVPPVVPQLFGLKDNRSRLAIFFLCCVPGCLSGASIAGTFLPANPTTIEGFGNIAIFSGTMMTASSIFLLGLRLSYSRKLMVFL